MTRWTTLFAVVAFIGSGCAHGTSSVADRILIEKSETAYAAGDFAGALTLIRPLAEKGNADAEFAVGLLTLRDSAREAGKPTEAELLRKAWEWIKKAATHGNDEAIMHVADTYKNGWYGFQKNEGLSSSWRSTLANKSLIADCLALEKSLQLPDPVPQPN